MNHPLNIAQTDEKVDWLLNRPAMWVGIDLIRDPIERYEAHKRLKIAMRHDGLYAESTNLSDINLCEPLAEARKQL